MMPPATEELIVRRSAAACSLLPCPFCGSADVGYYAFTCVIRCHDCGTEGPIDALRDQGRLVAAELWNRRANAEVRHGAKDADLD
jgi:Lar family restriction alleviation protein